MTAPSAPTRMPALYLGHGAPPLVDDPVWPGQLAAWSARLPQPTAILVVSAHWEAAPLTIGATRPTELVELLRGQVGGEVAPQPLQVQRRGTVQQAGTGPGKHGKSHPAIRGTRPPSDQPSGFHAVGQAGEAAAGK